LDEGFTFSWSCNSHPNLLDAATMRLMRRAGCWQIAYGIESGSQRVLDVVKREVRISRMRETLRMTRAAGIRAKGFMMLGHPTEGTDSLAETAAFLRTVELDFCQITKFTPYPGTPAYPTIHQHGTFVENWEIMNAMNFVFVPRGLTVEVLEDYFDHCYRAFYSRPDVLWGLARLLVGEPRFIAQLGASARVYVRSKFDDGRYVIGRLSAGGRAEAGQSAGFCLARRPSAAIVRQLRKRTVLDRRGQRLDLGGQRAVLEQRRAVAAHQRVRGARSRSRAIEPAQIE